MKISITLPSIYPAACERALENIVASTICDVEIIVVSPFKPPPVNLRWGQTLVWLEEKVKSTCAAAHDRARYEATGDFVTAFADDFLYTDRWDEKIVPDFLDRERRWVGPGYVMGLRYKPSPFVGTVFGMYYANFPFMRRASLERFGYIGPEYKRGFGDSDLGMRVWSRGGRCEFSADQVLLVTPDDQRKGGVLHDPSDMALFLSRWAPVYGKGWRTKGLRGFNLDIVPEEHPGVIFGRTVNYNDPEFRRAVIKHAPPYLIDTVKGVNIVAYGGGAYALHQAMGAVDLDKPEDRARVAGCYFDSVEEARESVG